MIEWREWGGHPESVIRDRVIRILGITVSTYESRRYGVRIGRGRLVIDFGHRTIVFWRFA